MTEDLCRHHKKVIQFITVFSSVITFFTVLNLAFISFILKFFMSTKNCRTNDGVTRMFLFLSFFCISDLIVYFAAERIHGYEKNLISKPHTIMNSNFKSYSELPKLYPRSIEKREFIILVFGWKRKESLERLVKSLQNSEYLNKSVQLQFHIEFEPSKKVHEYVESVQWPFGTKTITYRNIKFGLERMIMESWNPSNDNEFAFFFEDDIEVHPFFFKFALKALDHLEIVKKSGTIVGIALNTPRFDEVNESGSIWLPENEIGHESKIFLFQQACSWGALYFPWKWQEFLNYYNRRRHGYVNKIDHSVVIPKSFVNLWDHSWKKYLMEMMILEGYVMIYPSLHNQEGLSMHHREEGEHTGNLKNLNKVVDYFVIPITSDRNAKLLIEELQKISIDSLPKLSFYHFRVESLEKLKEFGKLLKANKQK